MTAVSEKVRRRIQIQLGIAQVGESRAPELLEAVDEAVDCRNRCVHGHRNESDADCEPERIRFLTRALEFLFAASDLVEAGWGTEAWSSEGGYSYHPLRSCFLRCSADSRLFGKYCLLPAQGAGSRTEQALPQADKWSCQDGGFFLFSFRFELGNVYVFRHNPFPI